MIFIFLSIALLFSLMGLMFFSLKSHRKEGIITTLVLGGIFFIFWVFCFIKIIDAGEVGVQDKFGKVKEETLRPGINFIDPFVSVTVYSYKTQEIKENMTVPSKEGLPVQLEISLLYSLNPAKANEIYQTVESGDYLNVILIPQFRSVVRGVTAKFEAKALYTGAREKLTSEIIAELQEKVGERGILVENAPLRQIILPDGLTKSIEEKLQAEQESQRMSFILQKETQEAERKRIEAQGIADFQAIVSEGINNNLLKWKGIEATEKLAESTNAKVVVIGAGKDGLPLILGN